MYDHIVRPGGLHGGYCVKGLVVDHHALQSVGGRVPGLGHHHGHDVARIVGLVHGHRQVGRILHVLGDRPGTGQRGSPVTSQLLAGVHGDHTVGGQCTGSVDRGDAGVGVGTAHTGHPEGTRQVQVVDEFRLAGEQGRVLLADPALADDATGEGIRRCVSHCQSSSFSAGGGQDGLDDVLVAGTAAEIALQALSHSIAVQILVFVNQ